MSAAEKLAEVVDRHFALISAELEAAVEKSIVPYPKLKVVLAELTAAYDEWLSERDPSK